MNRYFSYHVHFEHPSLTDPWMGQVEDWSPQRPDLLTLKTSLRSSLAANTASRILDPFGRIQKIRNNLESLNFSIEPQYLDWIEHQAPNVYRRILDADRRSCEKWSGRGNALGTPWAGALLPLASPDLQRWLIRRGVQNFSRHFGRLPQGFWLPEAGVNTQVLDALLAEGIEFVLLGSSQVQAVAAPQDPDWKMTGPGGPSATIVYRARRPSGDLKILLGSTDLNTKVLQERHLRDADKFYGEILQQASHLPPGEALIAFSSGRLLGELEPFGDMGMAALLEKLEDPGTPVKVCPAAWFASHSPEGPLVKLPRGEEDWGTALGCSHGLARWLRNCGCAGKSDGSVWKRNLFSAVKEVTAVILTELDGMSHSPGEFYYECLASLFRSTLWDASEPDDPRVPQILHTLRTALTLLPSLVREKGIGWWSTLRERVPELLTGAEDLGGPSWLLPGAVALASGVLNPPVTTQTTLGSFLLEWTGAANKVKLTHSPTGEQRTLDYEIQNPGTAGLTFRLKFPEISDFQDFPVETLPGSLRVGLAQKATLQLNESLQPLLRQSGEKLLTALEYHKRFQLALPPGLKSMAQAYFQILLEQELQQGSAQSKVQKWETLWAQAAEMGIALDKAWSQEFLETQVKTFLGGLGSRELLDGAAVLKGFLEKSWKWNISLELSVLQNEVWQLLEEKKSQWGHVPAPQEMIEKMDLLGEILGFNLEDFRSLFFAGEIKASEL